MAYVLADAVLFKSIYFWRVAAEQYKLNSYLAKGASGPGQAVPS